MPFFSNWRLNQHYVASSFAFECNLIPLFILPGNIYCSEFYGFEPDPLFNTPPPPFAPVQPERRLLHALRVAFPQDLAVDAQLYSPGEL